MPTRRRTPLNLEAGISRARIRRRVPGDIFAWAKMRQRHAERSRLAGRLLIRDEQLLPRPAHAVVGRLMNVNMAVLVETEQCRLGVISHCLEELVDRGKAIGKPITVRKNLFRAPSAPPISCSTQRRTSGGAALSCSKEM